MVFFLLLLQVSSGSAAKGGCNSRRENAILLMVGIRQYAVWRRRDGELMQLWLPAMPYPNNFGKQAKKQEETKKQHF
jgi:hypothetical protein